MKLNLIVCFVLCIIFIDCNNSMKTNDDQFAYNPIIPLKIGNFWKYENWHKGHTLDTLTSTIENEIKIKINDSIKTVFLQSWDIEALKGVYWVYSTVGNGINFHGGISKSDTVLINSSFLIYPFKENANWSFPDISYTTPGDSFEIGPIHYMKPQIKKVIYKTPIGEFDCYVYQETIKDSANWYTNHYYFPSLGNIGFEEYLNDSIVYKRTLIEYKLNSYFNKVDLKLFNKAVLNNNMVSGKQEYDKYGRIKY